MGSTAPEWWRRALASGVLAAPVECMGAGVAAYPKHTMRVYAYSMINYETDDNQVITPGNTSVMTDPDEIGSKIDHLDEQLHAIRRTLDEWRPYMMQAADLLGLVHEHRPALNRGLSMLDPGNSVRSILKGGRHRDR